MGIKHKKIIELFKTSDFTIAYHDSSHAYVYKGKHNYEDLSGDEYFDFNYDSEGYIPLEVALLVKALGGKCVSA
jgi:hypothetical protein